MRRLIYSDVHGNLPAFETMLAYVGNCDQYICLGDLVNYGPWSNECVDLACSLPNTVLIMGNHEEAFINGYYNGNKLVKSFFEMTFKGFTKLEVIKRFESSYELNDYHCTHTIENRYIYPDSSIQLTSNCIIGHSHHQFSLVNNGYELINVGSVGQNRKKINQINCGIFNDTIRTYELLCIEYDASLVINEMRIRDYPDECIDYYLSKL